MIYGSRRPRGDIDDRPYKYTVEYVAEFARSVRGLQVGAPVEDRGVLDARATLAQKPLVGQG